MYLFAFHRNVNITILNQILFVESEAMFERVGADGTQYVELVMMNERPSAVREHPLRRFGAPRRPDVVVGSGVYHSTI